MIIEKDELFTRIIPDEGKKLTNGDVIADYDVCLGEGNSIEEWYEIDDELEATE